MNGRFFSALSVILSAFCLISFTASTFAEDKTEPVKVDASESDQNVTVGNVDADQFGVHVRAENGHTAFVRAEKVRAEFVPDLYNAALYVFSSGNGSLADVQTKTLAAEKDESNNYGANVRVMDGARAIVNTGIVTGDIGFEINAEGKNSSVLANTGDLNVRQYGLLFHSSKNAEIEVNTGNIHAIADGIFNPYFPMAESGGKVRITAKNVVSDYDFGIGGFVSGPDSELSLKTDDVSAEVIGMDLSAQTHGKVIAETGNVTVSSTSDTPFYTRRSAGGHSSGDGSSLHFKINGSVSLSEAGNSTEENLNQQPSEGVFAASSDAGYTVINIEKGVTVKAEKTQPVICGIRAENAGGTVIVTTGSNVSANVPNTQKAYGLYIDNSASRASRSLLPINPPDYEKYPDPITPKDAFTPKKAVESKTEITIDGDLSGTAYGLYLEPGEDIIADVLVTGTISGGTAGILVSEDTTEKSFDLTVWSIIPNSDGCTAVKTDGSCAKDAEASIKYIIKVSSSQSNYILTDQNGNPLEKSHGYPVAKTGDTVCCHTTSSINDVGNTTGFERGNCKTVLQGGTIMFFIDKVPAVDFYRILDREGRLPATGFPTHTASQLALRPEGLVYGSTGLTLQIPSLDVIEPIVTVPKTDGIYPVEWLENAVGLLENSSVPGKGFAVLTGHNHLNDTSAGPFLFLSTLEENDRILVTDKTGNVQTFRVYGNHRIAPDAFNTLADELTERTLLLVTCEDESADGGYLYRRVILAEEM